MPACFSCKIDLMGDAQGLELFVQSIVAAVPEGIRWIDAKKDVPGRAGRWNMHERGILPTLLLRIVKLVNRRSPSIQLVVLEGRRDRTYNRKEVGVLECQAQGALTTHAESLDGNSRRAQSPALAKKG